MKEWIEINKELPKNGQTVNIKFSDGSIKEQVLFSEGRFWKKRIRPNVGHTWEPIYWAVIEKKKIIRSISEERNIDRQDEERKEDEKDNIITKT